MTKTVLVPVPESVSVSVSVSAPPRTFMRVVFGGGLVGLGR